MAIHCEKDLGQFILEMSPEPIRFEPVSKLTNVFFDEANCQVFAVRSGGSTGIVVKGPKERDIISFRMVDKGEVNSMKFSPDQKILSIQRCPKSVEFVNFNNGDLDGIEYSQSCKGKTTKILGFAWTNINEVVFVTDHSIEHYQVIPEKHILKTLKTYSVSVNWYVFYATSNLLLLSSGSLCNVMHPFQFKHCNVFKLSKFEIDLPVSQNAQKAILLERDVSIATIYDKTCILVLRHQPRYVKTAGAEIVIYTLQKDGPPRKTDILKLDMSGRYAVNVIDNVIVVHHQTSKTSMLYDIQIPGESDGFVTQHMPIVPPLPIKPFVLKVPVVSTHVTDIGQINYELYSPNWVVFQPNIVIDAKLGCLWNVNMHLDPIAEMIPDKCKLIDFLILRVNSKSVILRVCRESISPYHQLKLDIIARIFDKLNCIMRQKNIVEKCTCITNCVHSVGHKKSQLSVIDQSEMCTYVFCAFENQTTKPKFIIAVLLEYIRSLAQHHIYAQHFLCKMLIEVLVQHKLFYQLHQFLQYNVLSDSKHLACLMLSLQDIYPPAHQLALDMWKRLQNSNEEIIEVLLSRKQILPALRFTHNFGNVDNLSAPKYLSASISTGDNKLFYAVHKFFEQRNIRLRGSRHFLPAEHCDMYVKHFEDVFCSKTLKVVHP